MILTLKKRFLEAEDTYSFIFEPSKTVSWVAGQTIGIELETEFITEERHFTISSAPFEKVITITTRISNSDFKQALSLLQPGDRVSAFAVGGGDFVWEDRPSVFIAGGIGVTPFFSVLKQLRYENKLGVDIDLIYSARSSREVFKDEFQKFQKEFDILRVNRVIDARITRNLIKEANIDLNNKLIYISGPTSFVDDLSSELLDSHEVSETNLKRDWFSGL